MDANEKVTENKALRRDINLIIQRLRQLPDSPERSQLITNLEEALKGLRLDLKQINQSTADQQSNG